jgi:hypothetical protein
VIGTIRLHRSWSVKITSTSLEHFGIREPKAFHFKQVLRRGGPEDQGSTVVSISPLCQAEYFMKAWPP